MKKRIVLFLVTNLAVVLVLSVVTHLLGLNRWIDAQGLNISALLMFCFVTGMLGSGISLLMSKPIAKWSTGARVITEADGVQAQWLVTTVAKLAKRAGIAMPEVAIYDGAPNAFATGYSKDKSLVAVSTGLLDLMTEKEVEAVLAHEVSHAASGDMLTLSLLQGIVNTFVMFIARFVGYFVDKVILHGDDEEQSVGWGYTVTVIVLELSLGLLASIIVASYSRRREFKADAGAVALMNGDRNAMIDALKALGRGSENALPSQMKAFGISGGEALFGLFASHPPLADRISALRG